MDFFLLLAGERDLVDLVDFIFLLGVSPREIYKSYKFFFLLLAGERDLVDLVDLFFYSPARRIASRNL